jgi:hypothetical protein
MKQLRTRKRPAAAVPPLSTAPGERSNRRNQKEMKIAAQRLRAYKCGAFYYNFSFAFMVQRRFNENRKGDCQCRPAPTQRLPKNRDRPSARSASPQRTNSSVKATPWPTSLSTLMRTATCSSTRKRRMAPMARSRRRMPGRRSPS